MTLAIISFLTLVIYIIGGLNFINFLKYSKYDESHRWFRGGIFEFMKDFSLYSWFFIGVEAINLICSDIEDPKIMIPKGYISCIVTLIITCIFTIFVCCSLPPGIFVTSSQLNPLNYGYHLIFKIPLLYTNLLILPSLFATSFGFIYCFGKKLSALGESKLIFEHLALKTKESNTPYFALISGSLIGLLLNTLEKFVFQSITSQNIYEIALLCGCYAYLSQLISYIYLQYQLSTFKSNFYSPLDTYGALIGIFVFIMVILSVSLFQENHFAIIIFLILQIILTLYYYFIAQYYQTFSKEEQTILLDAHVAICKVYIMLFFNFL